MFRRGKCSFTAHTNVADKDRAHAVRRNRPITLPVLRSSPPLVRLSRSNLCYLASIFRPLDEVFFAVWNGSTHDCSKDWLLRLEQAVTSALPAVLIMSNEENSNIRVSQFWLRIKLWELFPRFGYLSTESVYECLTFRYPVLVARDLTFLAMKLPAGSFQVHGVGMVSDTATVFRCVDTNIHRLRRSSTLPAPLPMCFHSYLYPNLNSS